MNFKKYCYKIACLKKVDDLLIALEHTGVGSVVVVDGDFKLLGLVTDGDIRRAILKKETKIENIINSKPEIWLNTRTIKAGINYMKKIHRNILPVVNDDGIVVDILCLNEISFDSISTPVVIMAGGLGTRLYPLTKETPKPMLLANGKPILERIIDRLASQGFGNFYISINYLGEQIKDYFQDGSKLGVSIQYIEETKRLGTAGSLFELKNSIHEPFIVMNGDIVTDLDFRQFLDFHKKTNGLCTMCLCKQVYQIPFGVVEFDDDSNIIKISEKPNNEYYVNMGIYVVSPGVIKYIPNDQYYDMPSLFQNLIDDSKKTKVFLFDGFWSDIGRIEDYRSINL